MRDMPFKRLLYFTLAGLYYTPLHSARQPPPWAVACNAPGVRCLVAASARWRLLVRLAPLRCACPAYRAVSTASGKRGMYCCRRARARPAPSLGCWALRLVCWWLGCWWSVTRGGSPPSPRGPPFPRRADAPYAVELGGGTGVRSRAPLTRSLRLAPRLASPLVSAVSLRYSLRAPLAAPAARPFALAPVGWWRFALPSACGAGGEVGQGTPPCRRSAPGRRARIPSSRVTTL